MIKANRGFMSSFYLQRTISNIILSSQNLLHKNAVSKVRRYTMGDPAKLYPEAYKICKKFVVSDEQMVEVMNRMRKEIDIGLARATNPLATIKCWITYVQQTPTGKERGKYLALDLGGTHFRVIMVTLNSESDVQMISKKYVLSKTLVRGPGKALFDHIAECLELFVKENKLEAEMLPLGFTFSFPVQQLSLAHGTLVKWTKGFNCSDVVGMDVVQLLSEAIARRGNLKINIVALLNDTTGTLMSCAWKDRNCRIGLIVGTGCNACYIEDVSKVEMFDGKNNRPYMIINCEWGAFGDNGVLDFIRTDYDKKVDSQTLNVGRQLYEKCTSGMYLGELVRLIIVDLMQMNVIFVGQEADRINTKWKFSTKYISEIEKDTPGVYKNVQIVMDSFGIKSESEKELATVHYICETISKRSACLVAAGLSCLTNKMGFKDITIGVDGGVYRKHPHYHNLLTASMKNLIPPDIKNQLIRSEDGSGRGAALIAAVAVYEQLKNSR